MGIAGATTGCGVTSIVMGIAAGPGKLGGAVYTRAPSVKNGCAGPGSLGCGGPVKAGPLDGGGGNPGPLLDGPGTCGDADWT